MSELLILATEAAESAGRGPGATIAVVILLVALAAFAVAFVVVGPGRRRGPRMRGDIPLAMRPYHSDEELETTGLERAMSWGVALSVFAALFLPLYWLVEPARINDKIDDFYKQDVTAGRLAFAANCAGCHGASAEGGQASHPDPNVDAPWPAPPLNNIVARYEDSPLIENLGVDHISRVRTLMMTTIRQGRAGTPMPAWSTAFQGAMNDQQIEEIVSYLLSIQTGETGEAQAFVGRSGADLFDQNCARCHGFDADGRVGPSLREVFARYGANEGDEASTSEAVAAIRSTILNGRYVPTGAPMPAHRDVLTEDAVDRIVAYLQTIQR